MRVFRDESGVEWVVWAVRPGREPSGDPSGEGASERSDADRRGQGDRRVAPAPEPVIERRRGVDRRATRSERAPADRIARTMPPALVQGWLAFQSDTARRRLAPIPDGWASCPDGELERLCRRARPVPPAVTPVPRPADLGTPPPGDERAAGQERAPDPSTPGV